MNLHRNLRRSKKGVGTVFGMVFFLLIVMIVFASFMVLLNQNTGLEQATIQAKQLDLDRYTELQTVSVANPETAVLNHVVYISCLLTDNGTLPAQFVRLWIKDLTLNTTGNTLMAPAITLQPGSHIYYFNSTYVANAGPNDQFTFWFITARGNPISAYPATNQFNGITSTGTFPGVASINSTYSGNSTPLQLSLTTTQPNQLIYVVVSYDDGNTLYTPTSTPSLTWTLRGTSSATSNNYGSTGDSILKTFYAIDSSAGPITISIHSTADELSDYYCSALAFAISNVNTTSPFDGSPQTSIGISTMPYDTITTQYSNDFVVGALGIDDLSPVITPGAGFAQIMPVQSSYGASGQDNAMPRSVWSEWDIVQTPTTNLPVNCTFTASNDWAIILDAVRLVVIPPTTPVSLSPTSGPLGTLVTVSGQGFAANSQLIAIFNGSQVPFSFTTDGSGNIPTGAVFTVPQGSPVGNNNVTIFDSKFNYASANFTVIPSSITVSPQIGPVGTSVTVTGSNFVANSPITINFDGNSTTTNPSTIAASATGGFSATFNITPDVAGVKQVSATDGFNYPSANFTVTPSITLNPTNGPIGSSVNVTGSGFAASQPVIVMFAGSTIQTIPVSFNTNSVGFFNASFTTPNGQTAGGKIVNATDASLNSAIATFTVTPSISLSPTSGNAGSTVTVSGSGFAASKQITATFAGSSVTLSGTTSTDSTGAFSGATFTVPTSTAGGSQTVVIRDANSNSANDIYTVNTLTQKITVTLSNSAPAVQVVINGGYPQPNTLAADGTQYSIQMVAGAPFTLSFSNSGNTRDGFIVSNAFSATSVSYTASINSISVTAYEQVQNSFSTLFNGGNPASGDSLTLAGTNLGSGSSTIVTLNSGNSWSASAWSDYGNAVTFPASSTLSGSNERWAIRSVYSTVPLTAGGNPYSQTYYNQYSFQLDYAVSGSGSPTASTLTAKQFGSSYTPTLGTSLVTYWLDNGQSWSVTNPLGGSGPSERWDARPPVSGAVSSSSPTTAGTGTLTFTYFHQFLLTVTGGNGVTYGTVSPTGDNWYDSGASTTVLSNGVYSRASGTGQRVSSWQIDSGAVNNVATTGSVTTTSVTMSAAHSVTFVSVTQYLLTNSLDSGAVNSITSSSTGDSWYDGGTTVNVVLNNVWGSSPRSNLFSYTVDSTTTPVTRSNTGTVAVPGIVMNAAHGVSDVARTQYYLTVNGGNGVTYGTASPTGDQWYDSGTSTTVSSNWVWGTSGGSRSALSNWQLDGTNQGPTRHNTGTLTTSSISMSAAHTVNFVGVTQYLLTVTGGNNVGYGSAPAISGDTGWYDNSQSTTVTSDWVWTIVSGQSRAAITNYAIDSAYQNPTRQYSGTLTTSSVSMTTYHTVSFASTTQYYITFAVSPASTGTINQATGWFDSGSLSITATPNTNYHFSSWSGPSGVTFTSSTSASTSATIGNYGTITANFGLNLALDGTGTGSTTGGTTFSITTFSTSKTNDLIYVSVMSRNTYVTGIAATGLTLTCRQTAGNTISWSYSGQPYYFSTWSVVRSSTGSLSLTVTMSGSTSSASAVAYGVSNVNTVTPFDGSAVYSTGSTASASVTDTTSNPNDMIIGAIGVSSGTNGVPTLTVGSAGSGFNTVNTATQNSGNYRLETSDEYQILTTTQTNFAVGYTLSTAYNWAMVADDIQPAQ